MLFCFAKGGGMIQTYRLTFFDTLRLKTFRQACSTPLCLCFGAESMRRLRSELQVGGDPDRKLTDQDF